MESALDIVMTRRQALAAAAGTLALLTFAGCSAPSSSSPAGQGSSSSPSGQSSPEASGIDFGNVDENGFVTDMKGDPAVKAGSVKTVLTANSVATEMALMLGGSSAAATLGQGFQYGEGSLNAKMYPDLGGVRTFTRDDCTVENVAAVNPDLVLIDNPDIVASLRAAGINVAFMAVTSPETITGAIQLLGAAIGGDALEKASSYTDQYAKAIADISARGAKIADADKLSVLYLRGIDGCCGKNSMPHNWITTVGAVNAMEEGDGSRVAISLEKIMELDPDVIVCESPKTLGDVKGSAALSELKALKDGAIYTAPMGPVVWSMGSSEAYLMLHWAANAIYPAEYDFDMEGIAKDYFKSYYGYEMTDDDLKGVLNPQ